MLDGVGSSLKMVKFLLQHFWILQDVARVWPTPSQHLTTRFQTLKKEKFRNCKIKVTLILFFFFGLDWSDWLLGTFYHSGMLSVGESYKRKQLITLPNAIFGNFSILVATDVYNYVFEHNDEGDNLKAQVTTFNCL